MKNKLIFRILGALASALIIVSVFVPFVSVTGYSPSLWQTYEVTNSLYLPIMIIVFGVIGVIFFALNIKTEFAYMSVGAITFFVIIQTIDIIDQGVFNTLSVGYYLLVVGALLTGIMAFLTNLKQKNKVLAIQATTKEEAPSVIDQIDKLYNEQVPIQNEISPIQPVNNVIQPLPIQPVDIVEPIQPVPNISTTVVQETQNNVVMSQTKEQSLNPTLQEVSSQPLNMEAQIPVVQQQAVSQVNPVLQEFSASSTHVMEQPQVVQEMPVNPVVQQFTESTDVPVQETPVIEQQTQLNQTATSVPLSGINEPVNPTVQEFNNPGSTVAPQPNSNALDIFGQPINK